MWEMVLNFLIDILEALVNLLPTWSPTDLGTGRVNAFLAGMGKLGSFFPVGDFIGALTVYVSFCLLFGLARPWLKWIKAD